MRGRGPATRAAGSISTSKGLKTSYLEPLRPVLIHPRDRFFPPPTPACRESDVKGGREANLTTLPKSAARLSTATGTAPMDERRIYVACLAAYNNGRLHGRWIDAREIGAIWDGVRAMLADSPEPHAEEWAIHDYDGFYDCHISEYAGFDTICDLAEFLDEYGELGAKLYSSFSDNLDETRAAFEDYAGEYQSAADFAEQLHEDTGSRIPQSLQYYIDWQTLARDMVLNGEIMVFQMGFDEVHVFWSR